MRVISATTEREVDCGCGARLSYWPADVVRSTMPAFAGTAGPAGVTLVQDFRGITFVRCPCCGAAVDVDG